MSRRWKETENKIQIRRKNCCIESAEKRQEQQKSKDCGNCQEGVSSTNYGPTNTWYNAKLLFPIHPPSINTTKL
jgi:hypothetical protein